MKGSNFGSGNGVTGLVNLPGAAISFQCLIYRWKWSEGVQVSDRTGRGDDHWGDKAPVELDGNIVLTGLVRMDGPPTPDSIINETGTITLTRDTGKTVVHHIRVTGASFNWNVQESDQWEIAISAILTSDPEITGFGTNTVQSTIPTAGSAGTHKAVYAGMAKTYDPVGLQTSAVRVIDLWGAIDDTDPLEFTLLASAITNAVTMYSGQVARVASFTRLSVYRAKIAIQFGVRTTEDDIEMPGTTESADPADLQSSRQQTLLRTGTTATTFGATTSVGGIALKLRATNTVQLHNGGGVASNGAWVDVAQYAHRTTEDDVEMPGSSKSLDVSGIASSQMVTTVRTGTASTTFSGTSAVGTTILKLRATNTTQLHDGGGTAADEKHADQAQYAHRTPEDDVEMDGTRTLIDESDVGSNARVTTLRTGTTITAYATTLSAGGVLLRLRDVTPSQVHDGGGTPAAEKWADVADYGHRNREGDIEMPGTYTVDDQSRLADQAKVTTLRTGTTVTAFASTITAGGETLKLRDVVPRQEHDGGGTAANEKWIDVAEYGLATREDELEMGASGTAFDPSGLRDTHQVGVFTSGSGTSTAGFAATTTIGTNTAKFIGVDRTQRHDTGYLHVGKYGPRTAKDELEQNATHVSDDPSDLSTSAQSGSVRLGLTMSSFPSTTSVGGFTLKHRGTTARPLHDGAGVASNSAWIDVAEYGLQDREDEIEQGGTISRINFDDCQRDTITLVTNTTSLPSAIAAVNFAAGTNDARYESMEVRQAHDGKAIISYTMRETNRVVAFDFQTVNILSRARLSGTNVQVFLANYYQEDGTNSAVFLLLPQPIAGVVMDFEIRLRVTGATLPMYWGYTNTRNTSAFMGLPARTVTYAGVGGQARLSNTSPGSGDGVHFINQKFNFKSFGQFDDSTIPVGVYLPTTLNLSSLTRGSWIGATSVGIVVPTMTDSDYSVFL